MTLRFFKEGTEGGGSGWGGRKKEGLRAALRGRPSQPIALWQTATKAPYLDGPRADPHFTSSPPGLAGNMKLRLMNRHVAKPHPGASSYLHPISC